MIKAIRQSISFLPLLLVILLFPSFRVSAEPVNLLVNGSFNSTDGGWDGVNGQGSCAGGSPSFAPWGPDGLTFSYEYGLATQDVVVPLAGQVTLSFTGQLGQAGGNYEATLADDDESVSTGQLVNTDPEVQTLVITTQTDNEVVTVSFGGVDEAWWAGCYGPVITEATLIGESAPEETTTTTTPPEEYSPPSSGLDYWSYSAGGGQPQLPPAGQLLSEGHIEGLNYDWGGGEVLDSGQGDGVIVRFEGWLSAPEALTYYICAFTDDGFRLYLDETLVIDDWWDRGPSCGNTADVDFSDGLPKRLTAYFYENGGGAVAQLRYYTNEGSWAVIPDSWYMDNGATPPTTTTTTTIPETTTTTTIPEETTTTTEAPPVTEPEPTNPPDTTPEETSPPDTMPEETLPEETVPEETVPEETIPEETVPEETLPEETVPEETVPEETVPEETVPPVEEPALEEELAVIEDPAELEALIEEINLEEASEEELIAIISSEAFSNIDSDKIKAVIESVDFENLSDEQTAEIVNALNEADDSVKEVFEEEVNVYSGQFDAYVPSGSVITIAERRVVVAVTATTSIMGAAGGAGAGRRKQK